jgi:hypothetical protein
MIFYKNEIRIKNQMKNRLRIFNIRNNFEYRYWISSIYNSQSDFLIRKI